MNILFLDTTLPNGTLILGTPEKGDHHHYTLEEKKTSEKIHAALDEVLADRQLTLADIDHVIVTRGPGSFTGARVGLAIAQALQFSLNVPVTALTTLQALALSAAPRMEADFAVVIDSMGKEVYVQTFSAHAEALDEPICMDAQEAGAKFSHMQCIGNGCEKIGKPKHNQPYEPTPLLQQAGKWNDPLQALYLKALGYRKVNTE